VLPPLRQQLIERNERHCDRFSNHPVMHPRTVIRSFDAVLLDMNGTFMFGHDRFGDDQRYAATYRAVGGARLLDSTVEDYVRRALAYLGDAYANPRCWTAFPSVAQAIRATVGLREALPLDDVTALESVIAQHELGYVPPAHVQALHRLARTHRIGLCSNLWSERTPWVDVFSRSGIVDLFDMLLWSSDTCCVKPTPEIYERAIAALGVSRQSVVFVGDDPMRDIVGAKQAGLATVWINATGRAFPVPDTVPDLVVRSLLDLVS
jgi:HAD superfamily hydrolase (TIGR01509 family)